MYILYANEQIIVGRQESGLYRVQKTLRAGAAVPEHSEGTTKGTRVF